MKKRGFSLVELSIVLVILGLLAGGILAGQSLIKAAEFRKITAEASRAVTAIYTFRDKYMAIPGDMPNAYAFWGASTGCLNAATNTAPYTGCNGDGDGLIDDATTSGEDLRAYQFMALAGLTEGSYTGSVMPSGNKRQMGRNVPAVIARNASWWFNGRESPQYGKTGNALNFAGEGVDFVNTSVLTPEETWGIDIKLDDGKPTTGRIIVNESQTTCYSTVTGEYILATTTNVCMPTYWLN